MSVKTKGNTVAVLNVQRLAGDYGTTFQTPPTMVATEAFEMALVKDTNASSNVTRLYIYDNGAWQFVALTAV